MGTNVENAAKREATVADMKAQLVTWSTKLDGLVAGNLKAEIKEGWASLERGFGDLTR